MTIILLQAAALVVFAWLLRGLASDPTPKEIPVPVEIDRTHK